jgi:hypothetical protein
MISRLIGAVSDITPENRVLLETLVQRSLGLISEVSEIEKQIRLLIADLTLAGLSNAHPPAGRTGAYAQTATSASADWSRR